MLQHAVVRVSRDVYVVHRLQPLVVVDGLSLPCERRQALLHLRVVVLAEVVVPGAVGKREKSSMARKQINRKHKYYLMKLLILKGCKGIGLNKNQGNNKYLYCFKYHYFMVDVAYFPLHSGV